MNRTRKLSLKGTIGLIGLTLFFSSQSFAQTKKAQPRTQKPSADSSDPSLSGDEAVDVSRIQEKYWAQGKETELGVVQNRKYTSSRKFEFSVLGGLISSDPFLDTYSYGGSLGYNFNQYLGLHLIGWKTSVGPSEALSTLRAQTNTNANTNETKGFYGIQLTNNFLYGKLSLLGSSIIYVDLFVLGGAGVTLTENGNYFTPFLGIGQKIHLTKLLALHLDYRIMIYKETIKSKNQDRLGEVLGDRTNTTDAVVLGLSFQF